MSFGDTSFAGESSGGGSEGEQGGDAGGTPEGGALGTDGSSLGTPEVKFDVPDWASDFGQDHQKLVHDQKWSAPEDMAKSYANLRSMSDDGKRVKLPSPADDDAAWQDFYSKTGRPESGEAYDFGDPPEIGPGQTDLTPLLRATSFKHGLSEKQAQGLAADFSEFQGQTEKDADAAWQAEKTEGEAKIKEAWGADFEANYATAKGATEIFGLDSSMLEAMQKEAGTFNILDAFFRVGQALMPAHTAAGGDSSSGVISADQANVKIAELKGDAGWMKRYLDGGQAELHEMTRYQQLAAVGGQGGGVVNV